MTGSSLRNFIKIGWVVLEKMFKTKVYKQMDSDGRTDTQQTLGSVSTEIFDCKFFCISW